MTGQDGTAFVVLTECATIYRTFKAVQSATIYPQEFVSTVDGWMVGWSVLCSVTVPLTLLLLTFTTFTFTFLFWDSTPPLKLKEFPALSILSLLFICNHSKLFPKCQCPWHSPKEINLHSIILTPPYLCYSTPIALKWRTRPQVGNCNESFTTPWHRTEDWPLSAAPIASFTTWIVTRCTRMCLSAMREYRRLQYSRSPFVISWLILDFVCSFCFPKCIGQKQILPAINGHYSRAKRGRGFTVRPSRHRTLLLPGHDERAVSYFELNFRLWWKNGQMQIIRWRRLLWFISVTWAFRWQTHPPPIFPGTST